MKKSHRIRRLLPLAAAIALAFPQPGSTASISWSAAGSGAWELAANWSAGIPGASDDATISIGGVNTITYGGAAGTRTVGSLTLTGSNAFAVNGGDLTVAGAYGSAASTGISGGILRLNGTSALSSLDISGGTLAGTGTVTVSGSTTWTTGTMSGAGTSNLNGGVTLSGNGVKDLQFGRTLNLASGQTTTWSGNTFNGGGTIRTGSASTINNAGTFTDTQVFDARVGNDFGGAQSTLNNTGVYNKNGAGTTEIGIVFNNTSSGAGTGVVNLNGGTLRLSGGGTANAGSSFTGTGSLDFGGNYGLAATSSISAGNVTFSGGTITVAGAYTVTGTTTTSGGTVTFSGTSVALGTSLVLNSGRANVSTTNAASVNTLQLNGGTLGGTAVLNVANPFTFATGTMSDSGTTNLNGGGAFTGNGVKDLLQGRTLNLASGQTTTWSGSTFNGGGTIRTGSASTINNAGTFTDTQVFDARVGNDFGGAQSTFNNTGVYNKNGAGTTEIGIVFNNTSSGVGAGVVNLNGGTLRLSGGGTANAGSTFNIAAGRTLEFNSGTYNLNSTSFGAGTGTLLVSGATVNTAGAHVLPGTLSMTSGTLALGGAFDASALALSGGTISGTTALTIGGSTTWTTGTMSGAGTSNLNGGVTLSGNGVKDLQSGRTLNLASGQTTTWSGNTFGGGGSIRTGSASTINNAGTFTDAQAFNARVANDFGGAQSTFNNTGVYSKTGAGTTGFEGGVTFNNSGTVTVGAGTLSLAGGSNNLPATTLTGGVWQVQGSGVLEFTQLGRVVVTNAADIYLVGTASVVRGRTAGNVVQTLEQSLVTNAVDGALRLQQGRVFTASANGGNFTNAGLLELNDGTFNATTLSSNGTITSFGNSTLTTGVGNRTTGNGSIAASFGTLTITRGVDMGAASTMTVNPSGTIDLSNAVLASTIGTLAQNGSLNLGAQNLNVLTDYTNANFGSGNTFAPRAGVSGAGQIVGVNAAQTLTGNVTGAGANTFNLAFGNVRGGTASTLDFQVANSGTGASIRGALQNGAPGLGNISDARLSGTGVTAGNFGPIAAGNNSGNLSVTLTAGATGGALNGQSVAAVSNFGNVATQTLNITGFTTVLATGTASPSPVDLGNFRVGVLPAPTTLTVTNNTSGAGAERLGIASATATGNFTATNNLGAGFVAPGAASAAAIGVAASAGVVGTNNGTLAVQFTTNGALIDPTFTTINSNLQNVALTAQGFLVAQPTLPALEALGNFRAVNGVAATPVTIPNTNNAPAGFQEALNTTAGGTTGGVTLSGSINLLGQGASSNAMSVGFAAGGAAGNRVGTATVNLVSDGQGTSGLGTFNLPSQQVNVTGTAYALAQPNVPTGPLNLGNFRAGAAPTTSISITNTLVAAGVQEGRDVSAGALTGTATISGAPIANLAAGTSSNAIVLGLSSLAAGANSGTVTLNLASNGTTTSGFSPLALPSSAPISINATGWNLAQAGAITPSPVVLGNQRIGGALTQALTVSNIGPVSAFTEGLNASFGANTGNALNNGGLVSLLAGGASNNSSLVVRVDTTTAGARSGTATVSLVSDGTASTLGNTALASQVINVSGNVYQVAQPTTVAAVNLGNVRAGTNASQSVSITNTLAAPVGFQEGLDVTIGALTGNASGTGSITNLGAGASSSALSLGLSNVTAGNNSGTVTLDRTSNGTVSGLANLALPGQQVSVSAVGWRLAQANAIAPVSFGSVRVGGTASQALAVTNTAANDGFSERLNGSSSTGSAGITASGSFNLLGAGGTNNSSLVVGIDTASAGARSGTVAVALTSDGSGTSGLGQTPLLAQNVNVSGNVYQVAQPTTVSAVNLGNVRAGTSASQSVSITNALAAPVGFQEGLDVTIGVLTGNASGTGSITNLGAGSSSSALILGLSNVTAGNNGGTVTLDRTSNGTISGLANLALPGQQVSVSAIGWRLAQANAIAPVSFGSVRVGGAASQALAVTNTAPDDGFSERLNASASTASAGLSASGSFNLLSPNGTNNTGLVVGIDTASAGARNGTVAVALTSDGSGTSGLGQTALATQNVGVSGNVYQVAQPTLSTTTVNFGNFRAGNAQSQAVGISNPLLNATAAFQEGLNANTGATTGQATISGGPIVNLDAGAAGSNAISVGVSGVAGLNSGTATITFASNGTGTSGLANLALASQQVTVQGTGYRLAQAGNIGPINFGNVLRNSVQERFVTISNTAIADGFSEGLDA
ncbi:MAG: choice-of-anchor D domain-containing protein, partial [Pseudomonadota bacterium]